VELANAAVVVSDETWEFFDMADETTTDALVQDVTAEAGAAKRSAADTIREEAGKLGSQAADRARAFAGEGKDKASSALDEVAKMMKSAAEDVDAKLGENYGRYARSAADGISGFADSLRGKDVDDLLAGATDFVKKSPVIAVGTAAALGFVLARLIKSGIDAAADLGDGAPKTDGKPDA
jgi:ElaB/YqjD/DUF883 family membrane-anchored ribosome-binding protein